MIDLDDFELPSAGATFWDYCLVFSVANSALHSGISAEEAKRTSRIVMDLVMRLLKKHGSDSPGREDQRRFVIELLTKALAIAKGEEQL